MTPLNARQEPFCRWLVVLAAVCAVGGRRPAAIRGGPAWAAPASISAGFVYFCFGKKVIDFNALYGNRVYFCIPVRKGHFSKIKGLARNNVYFCILLHTFHSQGEWVLL